MTWTHAFLFVGYLVVAASLWTLGEKLVGRSPSGRKALPVVAVFWPIGFVMVVTIAVVALIESAFEIAADRVFGEDRDVLPTVFKRARP